MPTERKAAVIRVLFTLGLAACAVAAALWFGFPGFGFGGEDAGNEQVTPENIGSIRNQQNCVVVIHSHMPGNEDSERTRRILKELKEERYHEVVRMAELNVKKYPELAKEEGVTKENAPQLSFYVEDTRVGEFRGSWQKEPVQRKIDEILRGYMQRIGKDWRPPVPGMTRDGGSEPLGIEIRPVKK